MKRSVFFLVLLGLSACAPRVQMMDFAPLPNRVLSRDVAACRLEVEQGRTPSGFYTTAYGATFPYYDEARTNELYNLCMQALGYK